MPDRPVPDVKWPLVQPFWEAAARHELRIQRCQQCGTFRWYPTYTCPKCFIRGGEWALIRGDGRLFSWAVVRQAFLEGMENDVPIVTAIVELPEADNVRFVTRMVNCASEELRIGQRVRVAFQQIPDGPTLPVFEPTR